MKIKENEAKAVPMARIKRVGCSGGCGATEGAQRRCETPRTYYPLSRECKLEPGTPKVPRHPASERQDALEH